MRFANVEVVPIELLPHPNADSLSVVRVFDGYTVCVRTEDWKDKKIGCYVPPDSIVPNTPEYAWLEGHVRIKAKKLRGVQSYGLMVPVPGDNIPFDSFPWKVGDDLGEFMNILHYEPELSQMVKQAQGDAGDPPPIAGEKYDMESWMKYRNVFNEGEEVVITEKIHGTNSRYTFQGDRMYCGSHNHWRKEGDNLYWNILKICPWVEAFCRLNPNVILYGEIFGAVQKGYNYGSDQKSPYQFRAFDLWENGKFLDFDYALGGAKSDFLVPVLYRGPYSHAIVDAVMIGQSTLGDHIREGCVIKPVIERFSGRLYGRTILKAVSPEYLEGTKRQKSKPVEVAA